jgi:predicted metal-dependent hydrolase
MKNIIVGNYSIECHQKAIKNIHLSIHPPDGRIRLAVPRNMADESIHLFVVSKLSWIKKNRQKFIDQERQSVREFVSGESHYFLGHRYLLNINITAGKQYVDLSGKKMNLYVRQNNTVESREKVIVEFYRNHLKELVPVYIEKWEPILGVKVRDYGIKKMKTKWGTCNINAQRIWISLELAKKPPRCIEYIVVHEMIHLLEKHHNDKFISYMNDFLPNWQVIRDELNELIFDQ